MSITRALSRTFLNGLVVVLPVVLTVAALYWFATSLERVLGGLLRTVIPDEHYFNGLGLLAGAVIVFLVGLALRIWAIRRVLGLGEAVLERLPLAKSVYSGLRDLMSFVSEASDPDRERKVVLVTLAEDVRLIGLLTRDDAAVLGDAAGDDWVAVYLQMSYQIGGYTVFVPRERVTALDMDMEDAMRWVLTAGMSGHADADDGKP